MTGHIHRREFLTSSAMSTAALGFGQLSNLPAISSAAVVKPRESTSSRHGENIDRLVRLLNTTPPDNLVGVMVDQFRKGMTHREFLAAKFVAAAQPGIGHMMFRVHSIEQLGLDLPRELRPLSVFQGLTRFPMKAYSDFPKWGNRTLADSDLPSPRKAVAELNAALKSFDSDRAERAIIALARSEGPRQVMERLWVSSAGRNDMRSVGHNMIGQSNCWRTLETIGWQHAEPVLQFLVKTSSHDASVSDFHRIHVARVASSMRALPAGWASARADKAATLELLGELRSGSPQRAVDWTLKHLLAGKTRAGSVWDAVFLGAAEGMICPKAAGGHFHGRMQHMNTGSNAYHYGFRTCRDDQTRLFLLVKTVGWLAWHLGLERSRGRFRKLTITDIERADVPRSPRTAVEAIFSRLPTATASAESPDRSDHDRASRLTFALTEKKANQALFLRTARQLLCYKATSNAHDLKFPVAIFENCRHASPQWRPHLLAASVYYLQGTKMKNAPIIERAKEALSRSENRKS